MSQIAVGFKDATTGREKKTDGLWTHLGNMLLRTLTVTDKATLPAGTAQQLIGQYHAVTSWAGATTAGWVETVAQCTGTTQANTTVRIEAQGTVTNTVVNGITYLGLGIDGGLTLDTLQACEVSRPNGTVPFSVVGYVSNLSAGVHRFSIWMLPNSGISGFWGSPYTTLYVTEQRI